MFRFCLYACKAFTRYQKTDNFTISYLESGDSAQAAAFFILMTSIETGLQIYVIIVLSATVHEFFHGWVANYLGDPTARHLGRLTLNPIKHIDLIGTLLLPLFAIFSNLPFIGWAKPVPYNPYNLSDQKWGSTKVGLAGPIANFLIAIVFGLVVRTANLSDTLYAFFNLVIIINLYLGFFNLIPVPPLDGSKILMDLFPRSAYTLNQFAFGGIFIALIIAYAILPKITKFFYFLIVGA